MGAALESSPGLSAPFDNLASSYDDVFSNSPIGRAQRSAVWREMNRVFHPGHRILEINCGTGIDAMYLANRGIQVDAFDASPGMIAQAEIRVNAAAQGLAVQFRCLRTEALDTLPSSPPYDGVLSNFSGLNCISDLGSVARNLSRLVRPGGRAVLCLFGRFCLWEVLWYLSAGDFRKALRRFRRTPIKATLRGRATVTVYYRAVAEIRDLFAPYFRLERTRGVGVVVPPSYAGPLALKFPRLLRAAAAIDPFVGRLPIARSVADHVVLTLERVRGLGA